MNVTANGISIHYELDGPEDAPCVTLSHSLAANLNMWEWQMPAFGERFRVLRYDTRGHGGTQATDGDYTLSQLADDLFALLDALGIEATHFVGLSMGGMIGQTAALADQSRFRTLSLCDTSSRIPREALPTWDERIATARAEGMDALVDSTIDRWFSKGYQQSNPADVDKIRTMIRATPVGGYCGCSRAISGLNLTDQLSAIELPTLLVVGEDDPGTPVTAHEAIQAQIEGADLVVLPAALHFSNVEREAEFNGAILGFLARPT